MCALAAHFGNLASIVSLRIVKAVASNHIDMRISGCFTQFDSNTNRLQTHFTIIYIYKYSMHSIYGTTLDSEQLESESGIELEKIGFGAFFALELHESEGQ